MTRPECPHCDYKFSSDDMHKDDLWGIAHDEAEEEIECPSCKEKFWVRGSYTPHWACVKTEDEL